VAGSGTARPPLSGIVIARDEEERLTACLASLRPHCAELLVVLDARHTEGTRRAAEAAGARLLVHEFESHVRQKNVAVAAAAHDWLLSLDADEALAEGLAEELAAWDWSRPERAGRLRRRNWHLGAWVDWTGWRRDGATRLFNRTRARFAGSWVHDAVAGEELVVVSLRTRLLHWPYRDLEHHLEKINRYTSQLAREQRQAGRRPSLLKLVLDPPWKFCRMYLWEGGFLMGRRGFVLSAVAAVYVLLKQAKLWEAWLDGRSGRADG
jgi:glycosyltransferase involved in cell wall biosynthesis